MRDRLTFQRFTEPKRFDRRSARQRPIKAGLGVAPSELGAAQRSPRAICASVENVIPLRRLRNDDFGVDEA
jgi:hypothetical protein